MIVTVLVSEMQNLRSIWGKKRKRNKQKCLFLQRSPNVSAVSKITLQIVLGSPCRSFELGTCSESFTPNLWSKGLISGTVGRRSPFANRYLPWTSLEMFSSDWVSQTAFTEVVVCTAFPWWIWFYQIAKVTNVRHCPPPWLIFGSQSRGDG